MGVFGCVRTLVGNSDYRRYGHCVSGHAAVTEIGREVTFHGAWNSSSLPLLAAHQLLHPEVAQTEITYFLKK